MNLLRDPDYRCGAQLDTDEYEGTLWHQCHLPKTHIGPHECNCRRLWRQPRPTSNLPELD